jgi:hypothetical protein
LQRAANEQTEQHTAEPPDLQATVKLQDAARAYVKELDLINPPKP